MPFTRGFTDKVLHYLKLIKISHDKTEFGPLTGPKLSKGKDSQLKINPIEQQQCTNILKGSLTTHSARGHQPFTVCHTNTKHPASIRSDDSLMYFIF